MKSFSEFNGIFLPLLHIFKSSKIIYLNNVTLTHNLTFSSHTHFYRPFHQNHTPACLSVLNSLQDKPPHPMFVLVKHRTTLALQIRVYWKKKEKFKQIRKPIKNNMRIISPRRNKTKFVVSEYTPYTAKYHYVSTTGFQIVHLFIQVQFH